MPTQTGTGPNFQCLLGESRNGFWPYKNGALNLGEVGGGGGGYFSFVCVCVLHQANPSKQNWTKLAGIAVWVQ